MYSWENSQLSQYFQNCFTSLRTVAFKKIHKIGEYFKIVKNNL